MACGALSYRQKGIMEGLRDLRSLKKAGQNPSDRQQATSAHKLPPSSQGWLGLKQGPEVFRVSLEC